jgi:hypothetical protein
LRTPNAGHKFHRINVVAAVTHSKKETKKIAPECYNGSMTGDRFERWFEFNLLKNVQSDSTMMPGANRKEKPQISDTRYVQIVSIGGLDPNKPLSEEGQLKQVECI